MAHTVCLIGSGWLQPIPSAVLGAHPMVLAAPLFWGLHCDGLHLYQWFPWVSIGTPNLPHSTKPRLLSMTSLSLQGLQHHVEDCWQLRVQPGPPSEPYFYVLTLRKKHPRRVCLNDVFYSPPSANMFPSPRLGSNDSHSGSERNSQLRSEMMRPLLSEFL
jgi:hypothetical protein